MSERGQKIFKWMVWIVIAIIFAIKILSLGQVVKEVGALMTEGPITREEWAEQLADGFGDSTIADSVQEGEELATGEYAALSAMSAIGDKRLASLTENEVNDQTKIDLAMQYGLIEQRDLNKNLTRDKANEIIIKALNVYCSPDYYPEYFETKTNKEVIDADRWDTLEYDESSQSIIARLNGEVPKVGEIIMFTNEYGIAQAKHVSQISDNGEGEYTIQVSDVEDIAEIYSEISFSGASDFSYLIGKKKTGQENVDTSKDKVEKFQLRNPFMETVYAAEESEPELEVGLGWFEEKIEGFEDKTALKKEKPEDDTKKCDIEFSVDITDAMENGGKTKKVIAYFEVADEELSTCFKYDSSTGFTAEVSKDEFGVALSKADEEVKNSDTTSFNDEMGISTNIKIEGLAICTSGYFQWADPDDSKNYVEVLASADKVRISSAAKLSCEDKYKIGTINIPIAVTAGQICVELNMYLVVGADGELSIWYEINEPYIGINASVADGVKPMHGCSNKNLGVCAKMELNCGIIAETGITVFGKALADPGVDIRAYASAATVDINNTYKLKDEYLGKPCIELKAQAPVIELSATVGDSLLGDLLKSLKADVSYDLIEKDSDNPLLKKLTYHVEYEKDGKITVKELKNGKNHEEICTHIEEKKQHNLENDLKNIIDKKANKKTNEIVNKKTNEIANEKTNEKANEKENEKTNEKADEKANEKVKEKVNEKVNEVEEKAESRIEQMLTNIIERWLLKNCKGC